MNTAYLELNLIDDIVLSAHSATVGAHESLSHIPGATLLGVAAGKLYRDLRPEESFIAFHSGRVRFSNGLPLRGGCRTAPVPLSFHTEKSTTTPFYNLAAADMPEGKQPKAVREGFIDASGQVEKPHKTYRMKTAIDAAQRRAAEAQLFGYQALAGGQQFGAVITADADVDKALFIKIVAALCGEVRLGRSRSAEYGRVQVVERSKAFTPLPKASVAVKITILAMSDLAVVDAAGEPLLTPTGAALGFGSATVDFAHTFIRTRAYAPYNAKRRTHDLARQVICQGSVITLEGAFTEADCRALNNGVGIHRESGLGEVLVNLQMLADKKIEAKAKAKEVSSHATVSPSKTEFTKWLRTRDVGVTDAMAASLAMARKQFGEFNAHQKSARRYLGLGAAEHVGPSASQWGVIFNAAKAAVDAKALHLELTKAIDGKAKNWEDKFAAETGLKSFHTWYFGWHTATGPDVATIREFAKLAMDHAKKRNAPAARTQGAAA